MKPLKEVEYHRPPYQRAILLGLGALSFIAVAGLVWFQGWGIRQEDRRCNRVFQALHVITGMEAESVGKASGAFDAPACEGVTARMSDGTLLDIGRVQINPMPEAAMRLLVLTDMRAPAWSLAEIAFPTTRGSITAHGFAGQLAGHDVSIDRLKVSWVGSGDSIQFSFRFTDASVSGIPGIAGEATVRWEKDGSLPLFVEATKAGSMVILQATLEGAPEDAKRVLDASPGAWGKARIRDLSFTSTIVQGWGMEALRTGLAGFNPGSAGMQAVSSALSGALAKQNVWVAANLGAGVRIPIDGIKPALEREDAPQALGLAVKVGNQDVLVRDQPGRVEAHP